MVLAMLLGALDDPAEPARRARIPVLEHAVERGEERDRHRGHGIEPEHEARDRHEQHGRAQHLERRHDHDAGYAHARRRMVQLVHPTPGEIAAVVREVQQCIAERLREEADDDRAREAEPHRIEQVRAGQHLAERGGHRAVDERLQQETRHADQLPATARRPPPTRIEATFDRDEHRVRQRDGQRDPVLDGDLRHRGAQRCGASRKLRTSASSVRRSSSMPALA